MAAWILFRPEEAFLRFLLVGDYEYFRCKETVWEIFSVKRVEGYSGISGFKFASWEDFEIGIGGNWEVFG